MIIIDDKKLDAVHESIQHGFFGKTGGVSSGIYESLNCGIGSHDTPEDIAQNKAIVAQHFGLEFGNLHNVHQVHSADCVVVTADATPEDTKQHQADAMVTDQKDIILGVLTADCTPILLAGLKADGAPVIGAAHSGWGGSLKGIGEATVDKMLGLGADINSIQATIGPCIGPKSYEVSIGFEEPFLAREPADEHFFREAQKAGHLMFDMPGYVAARLARYGVKNVTITGHDTYALKEGFFSYRRKTHNNEPDYGRQISTIVIKG
jgi:YfiH family protein